MTDIGKYRMHNNQNANNAKKIKLSNDGRLQIRNFVDDNVLQRIQVSELYEWSKFRPNFPQNISRNLSEMLAEIWTKCMQKFGQNFG